MIIILNGLELIPELQLLLYVSNAWPVPNDTVRVIFSPLFVKQGGCQRTHAVADVPLLAIQSICVAGPCPLGCAARIGGGVLAGTRLIGQFLPLCPIVQLLLNMLRLTNVLLDVNRQLLVLPFLSKDRLVSHLLLVLLAVLGDVVGLRS